MKQSYRKHLLLFLFVLITLYTSLDARRPTYLSPDSEQFDRQPVMVMEPVTISKSGIIPGHLEKTFEIPQSVKIKDVGFLAFALSNDATQLIPVAPNTYHSNVVLPHLVDNPIIRDILKLRRTARQVRYQTLRKALRDIKELDEDRKHKIENYMSSSVASPLVITAKPPFPSYMATPGPCMIPMGAELLDSKGGAVTGIETAMINIMDLASGNKVVFSVKDALNNGTLALVVAHETAHAIQFDLYGKSFRQIQRVSTNGHDAPLITDSGLAYIEGWAEAFEAVYGPNNTNFKESDRKKYNISEFLYSRQDPIRRGRYVWSSEAKKRSGVLKNGAQLLATEGVIAGLFYDILTNRAITAPFEKTVETMLTLPMNFMEFIKNYVELFPEDKAVIYRIILEGTRYVTMDQRAAGSYLNYYERNVAYKQKKIPQEQYNKFKTAYRNLAEGLYKEAIKGADIFANVGPELWVQGTVELSTQKREELPEAKKMLLATLGKKDNLFKFRINLNTATESMLRKLGFGEAEAKKLVDARKEKSFFADGSPITYLKEILGDQFEKYNNFYSFAHFNHKTGDIINQYQEQALALWPEDFERMVLNSTTEED